jgi:mono/diheme cytochrome c family protein
MRSIILAFAFSAGTTLLAQQPEGLAAGQRLFAANCAVCHGVDGTGATTPVNLTRGQFKHGGSDQELFETISKGIPGTEMPGSFLKPGEIRQVVAFVQSLARGAGQPAGAGDATRGAELFRGKGGCVSCHGVTEQSSHGDATRVGPNLYGIGERRSGAVLQNTIPRIHRGLADFNWKVTAVTKAGARVVGTRLNEDTFSIQLRDSKNSLISLLKKDLAEWKVEEGERLPAFPSTLSAAEVSDLAAYLVTLR